MASEHERYYRDKKPIEMSHPEHDQEALATLNEARREVASAKSSIDHSLAPSGRSTMSRALASALTAIEAAIAEYPKNPRKYNPRD